MQNFLFNAAQERRPDRPLPGHRAPGLALGQPGARPAGRPAGLAGDRGPGHPLARSTSSCSRCRSPASSTQRWQGIPVPLFMAVDLGSWCRSTSPWASAFKLAHLSLHWLLYLTVALHMSARVAASPGPQGLGAAADAVVKPAAGRRARKRPGAGHADQPLTRRPELLPWRSEARQPQAQHDRRAAGQPTQRRGPGELGQP